MANYRLLIGYMMGHPGKKLLFMGNELASYDEWHYEKELPWNILQYPNHDSAFRYVKEVTTMYKNEPAFWQKEFDPMGFEWIQADNCDQSLYIFVRYANDWHDHIIVVMNCTPNTYDNYRIGVKDADYYEEIMNSDRDIYGGSNRVNPLPLKVEDYWQDNQPKSILMTIPPLGISFLKAGYNKKELTEVKKDETVKKPRKPRTTTKKTQK